MNLPARTGHRANAWRQQSHLPAPRRWLGAVSMMPIARAKLVPACLADIGPRGKWFRLFCGDRAWVVMIWRSQSCMGETLMRRHQCEQNR